MKINKIRKPISERVARHHQKRGDRDDDDDNNNVDDVGRGE